MTKQTLWGICNCGKWGEVPKDFNQTIHFLKCPCGELMFLHVLDPIGAGYREKDKIANIGLVPQ